MTKKAVYIFPSNTIEPLTSLGKIPLISYQIALPAHLNDIIIITDGNTKLLEDYLLCAHPDKKILAIKSASRLRNIPAYSQEIINLTDQPSTSFYIIFGNYFLNSFLSTDDNNWVSESIIHVLDHQSFWTRLKKQKRLDKAVADYKKVKMDCLDLSNPKILSQVRDYLKNDTDQEYDFSKPEEAIYFPGNRVVKYFQDEKIIKTRAARTKFLNGLTPVLDRVGLNYYSYQNVPGKTIYESLSSGITIRFLHWCSSRLWDAQKPRLTHQQALNFFQACAKFYKIKTEERINHYWNSVPHQDRPSRVNGKLTPILNELINLVDWDYLCQGTPVRFHGDLQFDNVLFSPGRNPEFILLDWRQDFAGLIEYGDIYYDLAKLYGGLIVPYNSIKKNEFSFSQVGSNVEISLQPPPCLRLARQEFQEFINAKEYDKKKIQLLTGIIFINMSPLHHEPFNYFLHHLGKLMLAQVLHA